MCHSYTIHEYVNQKGTERDPSEASWRPILNAHRNLIVAHINAQTKQICDVVKGQINDNLDSDDGSDDNYDGY